MTGKWTCRSRSASKANYFLTNVKSKNRFSGSFKYGRTLYVACSDFLKQSGSIGQLQFSKASENILEWNGFWHTALYYHCEHSHLIIRIFFKINFIHMWASYVLTLSLFSSDAHYLPIESLILSFLDRSIGRNYDKHSSCGGWTENKFIMIT